MELQKKLLKNYINKKMHDDSGKKKFKVYVKNPKIGNIKVIRFGDPNMRIKKNNPKRKKSFRARHKCDTVAGKNKSTARY